MSFSLPGGLLEWLQSKTEAIEGAREPDLVIGSPPYMARWHVIPRNRWLNVYYHRIMRSDADRALHDHPWPFNISILLDGSYVEVTPADRHDPAGPVQRRRYDEGAVLVRMGGTYAHRLELLGDRFCRTLFITGPRVREWGFWCPRGWKHWKEFTAFNSTGDSRIVGPGCGEV